MPNQIRWDNPYVYFFNKKQTGEDNPYPPNQQVANNMLNQWEELVYQAQRGNKKSLQTVKDVAWDTYTYHVQFFANYTWEDLMKRMASKDPKATKQYEEQKEYFQYDFNQKLKTGF